MPWILNPDGGDEDGDLAETLSNVGDVEKVDCAQESEGDSEQ